MKRTLTVFFVIFAFAMATVAAAAVYSTPGGKVSEVIKFKPPWKAKKKFLPFHHKLHSVKYGVKKCQDCHHTWKGSGPIKKCFACHKKTAADSQKLAKGVTAFKAFHNSCKKCHQKMKKGPTKCSQCHPK
jgi:hypothetical protein